jgi:hypothetical protein
LTRIVAAIFDFEAKGPMSGEKILILWIEILDHERRNLSTKPVMANLRKLEACKSFFLVAISCGRLEIRPTVIDTKLSSIEGTQKFHLRMLEVWRCIG